MLNIKKGNMHVHDLSISLYIKAFAISKSWIFMVDVRKSICKFANLLWGGPIYKAPDPDPTFRWNFFLYKMSFSYPYGIRRCHPSATLLPFFFSFRLRHWIRIQIQAKSPINSTGFGFETLAGPRFICLIQGIKGTVHCPSSKNTTNLSVVLAITVKE